MMYYTVYKYHVFCTANWSLFALYHYLFMLWYITTHMSGAGKHNKVESNLIKYLCCRKEYYFEMHTNCIICIWICTFFPFQKLLNRINRLTGCVPIFMIHHISKAMKVWWMVMIILAPQNSRCPSDQDHSHKMRTAKLHMHNGISMQIISTLFRLICWTPSKQHWWDISGTYCGLFG